jgi:hypothetical protein
MPAKIISSNQQVEALPNQETLERLAAEGYGAKQIAIRFGFTRSRIEGLMRSLGIKASMQFAQRRNAKIPIGEKFGRLTVVALDGYRLRRDGFHHAYWKCRCDCGAECTRFATLVRRGQTRSCGCLAIEGFRQRSLGRVPKIKLPFGESSRNSVRAVYRAGAKARGLDFSLTDQEFDDLTSRPCYYCGAPPANCAAARTHHGHFIYSGIDRFRNDLGYTRDNCVPCCGTCNRNKGTMSGSQYIELSRRIAAIHPCPAR